MYDAFSKDNDKIKKEVLLSNAECLKIAKFLTKLNGQEFKPESEKLFNDVTKERVNDYLKIILESLESKVSKLEQTDRIDYHKAMEDLISCVGGTSNECKAWVANLDFKMIYMINHAMKTGKSLNTFREINVKIAPSSSMHALEELYKRNHFTESLGIYLTKASDICNDIYDKSYINKFIDFNYYNFITNNILINCNDNYDDVYSIKHKDGKPKVLNASLLENELYHVKVLSSLGFGTVEINQFYEKYIKELRTNLIETNHILSNVKNALRLELNDKVNEMLTKRFYRRISNTNLSKSSMNDQLEMFEKNLESMNFDISQCKFILTNNKSLDIKFLHKILNQSRLFNIRKALNTLIYLKGKSIADICNIDLGQVKMDIDELCYEYFMNEEERKVVTENMIQKGTYDEYVPEAHIRMIEFTSKLI